MVSYHDNLKHFAPGTISRAADKASAELLRFPVKAELISYTTAQYQIDQVATYQDHRESDAGLLDGVVDQDAAMQAFAERVEKLLGARLGVVVEGAAAADIEGLLHLLWATYGARSREPVESFNLEGYFAAHWKKLKFTPHAVVVGISQVHKFYKRAPTLGMLDTLIRGDRPYGGGDYLYNPRV
mgnify:CR=1 FL=1